MSDKYAAFVASQRKEKDDAFKRAPWSPIPAHERPTFRGLAYYPADPAWRFDVKLVPNPKPGHLTLQASGGDARDYMNVGHFSIQVEGQEIQIQAYLGARGDSLFIPFRDATSGKDTYGAGRYLDLEWEGPDAAYALDFNLAYNPYCAYDDSFSCPFPPPENWLKIPVTAGEKNYEAA